MDADVVLLPRDLQPGRLQQRAVVVFDVLRATTSITAALAAGVEAIYVFPTLADAAGSYGKNARAGARPLLCGEEKCLRPPGFDLGNSPGAFNRAEHAGRVAFLSTTNGTRAILAAREAAVVFAGAIVNAVAVAGAVAATGLDVTLLCAGTGGDFAMEDVLGAGAVIDALGRIGRPASLSGDVARAARRLFAAARDDLPAALADSAGGRNVIEAGLSQDIAFAARLDALSVVGVVGAGEIDAPMIRIREPA